MPMHVCSRRDKLFHSVKHISGTNNVHKFCLKEIVEDTPKGQKRAERLFKCVFTPKCAEKFTEISIYGKKVRDSSLKYQFTPMRVCFRRDKLFRSFKKS